MGNVCVFFDNVEFLGNFIEFEAVCDTEKDIERSYQNTRHLLELLKIKAKDLIDVS
jgi:adenylate cyclase class IV